MMRAKQIWLDLRDKKNPDNWADIVNTSPIETVLVLHQSVEKDKGHFGAKINLVYWVTDVAELKKTEAGDTVVSSDETVLQAAGDMGLKRGYCIKIVDQQTMEAAWSRGIHYDYLLVELEDETNIPLELLIAQIEKHQAPTGLFKIIHSLDEFPVVSGVLEKGTDGVVLKCDQQDVIGKIGEVVSESEKVKLDEVEVLGIEYIGMGDRGCIDTTSLMTKDEGMIVGSTSAGGILVCSETHYLPYMELRPFRVNAGGVHSYVLSCDNSTRYISELKAGDKVLSVNTKGDARVLAVGRNKIERRPLLLIKGKIGDVEINSILQDDWHVRVMGADGKPRNITQLRKGDRLLGCLMQSGRHVGIYINETIIEK
ncbi:MAG: 3-dehydroquinate synthase II [Euryarchaeota archaeon]|nr:3-dehydroquinate synthase II [Euryarchaeota archaeon]